MVTSKWGKWIGNLVMIILTLLIAFPVVWLIFLSFKENADILNNPLALPKRLDFSNYVSAINTLNIGSLYKNTFIIAFFALIVEVAITFASSFALTRLTFKSKKLQETLSGFLLIGLAISPFILLFPVYRINRLLGVSEWVGLMLPYIATSISFNTLLFSGYLRDVPPEIDEAALIDGANLAQLIVQVIAPIARPVLATIVIFNLLYIWNEYPFASIMISKPADFTLSRGIAAFRGKYSVDYAGIAAYGTMIIIPELIFYGLFQRSVVDGMTAGAVKG